MSKGFASAYRPVDGVHDEMMDAEGKVREHWRPLIAGFDGLGPEALAGRFSRADRHLRDAGVFFRAYGENSGQEREWPLAHVPVLISVAEWSRIEEGLKQRAELLEALAADFYGENTLVAQGIIPPELIAKSAEFLRPMTGSMPQGGHFLHFCGFELGRGEDGEWRVLADRTQAPSGAGFALENRVAMLRALPEIHAGLKVHRLAGFFRDFRDALFALAQPSGRVAVLTPGIHNDTYFEHAYIARYLGLLLLEGEDLTVSEGAVMVRTVSGLKPVSVLWRRMDAGFLDPLEFNRSSRIGTAGLAEALRGNAVSMVNAAGSGLLETRALLAFMPAMCRALRGRELALPNIEAWWCGDEEARAHVSANADRLVLGPAFSTAPAFEDSCANAAGAGDSNRVAVEAIRLSTTPVFNGSALEPRPLVLRIFAARTPHGWTVMQGGLARIGAAADSDGFGVQRGGRVADVWVLSETPVEQISLLSHGEALKREKPGSLPSRAADNLFWLGRNIERVENAVRQLRAYHVRLAEEADPALPLLEQMRQHFDTLGIERDEAVPARLIAGVDSAVASAARVRDRFSPDGWAALNDLSKTVRRFAGPVQPGDDAVRALTVLLRKIAGFSGLVHENMYRFTGWRFLEIGRRLERGIQMAWIAARLGRPDAPEGALEMLLEIGDSVLSHRRRYHAGAGRGAVIELLVLDALNPRSLAFQAAALSDEIHLLPGEAGESGKSPLSKEILQLRTSLAMLEPKDATPDMLLQTASAMAAISDLVEQTYFR